MSRSAPQPQPIPQAPRLATPRSLVKRAMVPSCGTSGSEPLRIPGPTPRVFGGVPIARLSSNSCTRLINPTVPGLARTSHTQSHHPLQKDRHQFIASPWPALGQRWIPCTCRGRPEAVSLPVTASGFTAMSTWTSRGSGPSPSAQRHPGSLSTIPPRTPRSS